MKNILVSEKASKVLMIEVIILFHISKPLTILK